MKRSLTAVAAAALAVLCLSGCDRMLQEQPAPTPAPVPSQNESVEPAPAPVPELPEPAESPEPESPAAQETPYEMAEGVWLATTDAGYSNYYYFNPREHSGNYVNLEYGLGFPFTYEGTSEALVFHLEGHDTDKPAEVLHTDEEAFTLIWEDSLPERLCFVSEGTLEDFHFYSNHDLANLALEHYSDSTDYTPSMTGAMTNEDNTVTVQLYDNLGDHNSTAAWYVLDRFTATGTNLMTGEQVDLLEQPDVSDEPQLEDESPAQEDVPAAEESPAEDEIPAAEELPGKQTEEDEASDLPKVTPEEVVAFR